MSALLCVALLTGCVGSATPGNTDPRAGAALAYGLAPAPDQGTTFQKDVVLVRGGGSSVRSVTADGLTWTLAPGAEGAADLKIGRVMFLTERAVGRVAAIVNTSTGIEVTMRPVDITEVIRDGEFASQGDVAISDPIVVSGSGAFWADPALQQQAGVPQGVGADLPAAPAAFIRPAELPRPPAPAAIVSEAVKATTGGFDLTGGCCANGTGVQLAYRKNGLTLNGRIAFEMDRPTANFDLKIAGGKVTSAGLTVRGAAGISASLDALTDLDRPTAGFSPPLGTDFAFSVPVGMFFGVPLSMAVTQRFTLQVNVPGSTHLTAEGRVKLGSTIGFRYGPSGFRNTTTATLDDSASIRGTDSLSVGISWAAFDYNVRFTVGLGLMGFVAGVYLALGAHVMASVGAPIGFNIAQGAESPIEHCKSVQADLWVDYGVGYTIPASVVRVINFFLEAFHSTPVEAQGGKSRGWTPVLSSYQVYPQSGFCVKK